MNAPNMDHLFLSMPSSYSPSIIHCRLCIYPRNYTATERTYTPRASCDHISAVSTRSLPSCRRSQLTLQPVLDPQASPDGALRPPVYVVSTSNSMQLRSRLSYVVRVIKGFKSLARAGSARLGLWASPGHHSVVQRLCVPSPTVYSTF